MKDVFLCHATADKDAYVRVFADTLRQHGISYWLDEAEIKWGDHVRASINNGLATSRYVIAFISDAFLARKWPEDEMNAALSLEETRGCKVLLPLAVTSIDRIKAAYPLIVRVGAGKPLPLRAYPKTVNR
jgi:RNA-directed DNA polymerase